MTNHQASEMIQLTTDHRERQCVDLRRTFVGRYRFERDEAYTAERPESRSVEASWLTRISCRHGWIFPWGDHQLAAHSTAGAVKRRELERLPCVETVQGGGDCPEVVVVFDVADIDQVAAVMRPYKRRQYSATNKTARAAQLAEVRPVSKRAKSTVRRGLLRGQEQRTEAGAA